MDIPLHEIFRVQGSQGGPRLPVRPKITPPMGSGIRSWYEDEDDTFNQYPPGIHLGISPRVYKPTVRDDLDYRFWSELGGVAQATTSRSTKCRNCYETEFTAFRRKQHKNGDCRERLKDVARLLSQMRLCAICGRGNVTRKKFHLPLCSTACIARFIKGPGGIGYNIAAASKDLTICLKTTS